MGWDPINDIKRAVNEVSEFVNYDIGRETRNLDRNVRRDWQNAGRGEIGKWVSGLGQSAYNFTLAVPRAVVTGQYNKEFQRMIGSGANILTLGAGDYLGQSSGAQRALRSENLNKWTLGIGENLAGTTHAIRTGGRDAVILNDDRNNFWQLGVKAAAVYGAYSAYDYFSAPGAVPESSPILSPDSGFESANYYDFSSEPLEVVATTPSYGGGGVAPTLLSSGEAGFGAGGASLVGPPSELAVESAPGFWSRIGTAGVGAAAYVGETAVTGALIGAMGGKSPGMSGGDTYVGSPSGGGGYIPSSDSGLPFIFNLGDSGGPGLSPQQTSVLAIGALALVGLFLYKKVIA